jgi:hypothetical protein
MLEAAIVSLILTMIGFARLTASLPILWEWNETFDKLSILPAPVGRNEKKKKTGI